MAKPQEVHPGSDWESLGKLYGFCCYTVKQFHLDDEEKEYETCDGDDIQFCNGDQFGFDVWISGIFQDFGPNFEGKFTKLSPGCKLWVYPGNFTVSEDVKPVRRLIVTEKLPEKLYKWQNY